MWKYPQGFHRERRRKYPHRKLPFLSPSFPQGNYGEISSGIIPWNSPKNPRGNLGDVDGLPAGLLEPEFDQYKFVAGIIMEKWESYIEKYIFAYFSNG